MKRTAKHVALIALIALILSLCLTGCGSKSKITIDENGLATWEPVKNAIGYEYAFVDASYTNDGFEITTDTSVQVPKGYSVHLRAVFENGEYGEWMTSEYYGVAAQPVINGDEAMQVIEDDPTAYVDLRYDLKLEELMSYELISNIDYSSVRTLDDGRVYFEAAGPKGNVMRYVGSGISVSQGAISFEPGAQLSALDAIGRICAVRPYITNPGNSGNNLDFTGGYTFTEATSVEDTDELFFIWGFGAPAEIYTYKDIPPTSHMEFQPNFFAMRSSGMSVDAFTVSEIHIHYDESTYNTGIRMMALDQSFYGSYLEGDYYDPAKEVYDSANKVYTFYLLAMPELANEIEPYYPDPLVDDIVPMSLMDFSMDRYEIGELKNSAGEVLDRNNAVLDIGSTLEITIGDYTMDMTLPVIGSYKGAQTLHELVPYGNTFAQGQVTPLVVPLYWVDQPENATDELMADIYSELGRVEDAQGNVTDYSDGRESGWSLSEYYDAVSRGTYEITSFVTDWYPAPYNFADEWEDMSVSMCVLDGSFEAWFDSSYPDIDKSRFDRNGDGFYDSVIIINAGKDNDDVMNMATYSHAVRQMPGYTGDGAGTQTEPVIKDYISMNMSFLGGNTLVHEYGHNFGLIDYYDVTYSGIDAVGSFDMQSGSYGDWNSYSKYSVGWIEPQIVEGLEPGESVELTIGSAATTGDAIVIPAVGTEHDGPFGEYIVVDLFTPEGANAGDAAAFGLEGVQGVRIYHINALMEKRVLHGSDGIDYPIGTVHYANAYNDKGQYHVELIQAGGVNTFTNSENPNPILSAADFFYAGDSFSLKTHGEFFHKGLMDDGGDFGYTIEIVSIETGADGSPIATIRVTR